MSLTPEPKRVQAVIRLLEDLRKIHEQLTEVIRRKVDALRRADLHALAQLVAREHILVRRVQRYESLRRKLMRGIVHEGQPNTAAVRTITVSQFSSYVPETLRAGWLDAAKGLREAVARALQVNRLAGSVTRELVAHLRWVFATVTALAPSPAGYAPLRVPSDADRLRIVDAIG